MLLRKRDERTLKSVIGQLNAADLDDTLLSFKSISLLLNHRRFDTCCREGHAVYSKISSYSPVILPNVPFALQFDYNEIKSIDVSIYPHFQNNAFRVGKGGLYEVSTEWLVTISTDRPYFNVQSLELTLYKNGVPYKRLSKVPMIVVIAINTNYWFPFASLQGTKKIELSVDDKFDIRLTQVGSAPFDYRVVHGGYLDITYLGQKGEVQ